jgi:hypothetical protein
MAASVLNITIEQGSDYVAILTLSDPASVPINLTDFEFRGYISPETQGPVIAQFSFEIQNQTTNTGKVKWFMPNTVTQTIPTNSVSASESTFESTSYLYDVEMVDPGGVVTRILRGKVSVSPEVTK